MASERRLYVSRNHDRIYIDCAHLATSTWYFSTTRITSRTRRWNIAGKSFQKQVNNSLSGKYSVLIMLKSLSFTIATRFSLTARICRLHFSSAQCVPHFIFGLITADNLYQSAVCVTFKSSYSLRASQKSSSFCTQSRAEIYTDCIRLLLAWPASYFYFLLHFIMFGWFDYPEYVWSFEMLIPKQDKPGLFLGSCSPPAFSSCTERSLKIRSSFLKMKTCFLTQKQINHLKKPSL